AGRSSHVPILAIRPVVPGRLLSVPGVSPTFGPTEGSSVAGVRWEPVARLRRRMLPGVLLALGLPDLASCSTAARTGQATVTGMLPDNGGPPRQGFGQACGCTVPPVNICLQPDTISF